MALPLTRYQAEQILVARCRAFLARQKMSVVTDPAAPNADLNDPLAAALGELGFPPADVTAVADADLGVLAPAFKARFLDLAELRALETCVQQAVAAPQAVQWEDFRKDQGANALQALQAYVAGKWDRYLDRWARAGSAAVGHMERQNRNPLNHEPYGWPGWPHFLP